MTCLSLFCQVASQAANSRYYDRHHFHGFTCDFHTLKLESPNAHRNLDEISQTQLLLSRPYFAITCASRDFCQALLHKLL